jgi:phospho-N-acetylmuramoyl-pentapeptide-transferase
MLYLLAHIFTHQWSVLNLFKYITFRSGGAVLTAFALAYFLGPKFIEWLRSFQAQGQPIREDGPESHLQTKKGTPTMGGLGIIICIILSVLLWADLSNQYIWMLLIVLVGYGVLGAADDYLKLRYRNSKGVSAKVKMFWQVILSALVVFWTGKLMDPSLAYQLAFPFFKHLLLDLGLLYFIFGAVVMAGASNAVNLTDGLDGLATVPVVIVAACFALIAYLVGNAVFAGYLQLHYIANCGEITVFCSAMIGAGLGFLWYNAPPAQLFMGDVGSLALGGVIGAISIIVKHEIVLAVIGGVFVIEAISVILQVGSYKLRGKRIFKMAPIHHHYEKMGISESKIVIRFWILAIIFALIGLSTLKIR